MQEQDIILPKDVSHPHRENVMDPGVCMTSSSSLWSEDSTFQNQLAPLSSLAAHDINDEATRVSLEHEREGMEPRHEGRGAPLDASRLKLFSWRQVAGRSANHTRLAKQRKPNQESSLWRHTTALPATPVDAPTTASPQGDASAAASSPRSSEDACSHQPAQNATSYRTSHGASVGFRHWGVEFSRRLGPCPGGEVLAPCNTGGVPRSFSDISFLRRPALTFARAEAELRGGEENSLTDLSASEVDEVGGESDTSCSTDTGGVHNQSRIASGVGRTEDRTEAPLKRRKALLPLKHVEEELETSDELSIAFGRSATWAEFHGEGNIEIAERIFAKHNGLKGLFTFRKSREDDLDANACNSSLVRIHQATEASDRRSLHTLKRMKGEQILGVLKKMGATGSREQPRQKSSRPQLPQAPPTSTQPKPSVHLSAMAPAEPLVAPTVPVIATEVDGVAPLGVASGAPVMLVQQSPQSIVAAVALQDPGSGSKIGSGSTVLLTFGGTPGQKDLTSVRGQATRRPLQASALTSPSPQKKLRFGKQKSSKDAVVKNGGGTMPWGQFLDEVQDMLLGILVLVALIALFFGKISAIAATFCVGLLASRSLAARPTNAHKQALSGSQSSTALSSGSEYEGSSPDVMPRRMSARLPVAADDDTARKQQQIAHILQYSRTTDPRARSVLEGLLTRPGRVKGRR